MSQPSAVDNASGTASTGERRCRRLLAVATLPVIAAAGLAAKYLPWPARGFVNNWLSALPYEMFFVVLLFIIVPRRHAITPIAVFVCLVTCALEFAQLWQPPWLQSVRSTWLGAALLGTTFQWTDLPAYPIGCVLGWILLRALCTVAARSGGPGAPPTFASRGR